MPVKFPKVIIEISARHVHLAQADLEKLFGKGFQLTKLKALSQRDEFAANETVDLTAKNIIKHVRVLGPDRDYTQIEISKTDAFYLGLSPLVRDSGDLQGTPGITIVGPAGEVDVEQGVILSHRHIHCSSLEAQKHGLKEGQLVKVKVNGQRGVVFDKVMIKVREGYVWRMHIDTDEANAAGVDDSNNIGEIIVNSNVKSQNSKLSRGR
jgi:propanediol utilization protein